MVHDKEYEGNIVFKEEELLEDKRTSVNIPTFKEKVLEILKNVVVSNAKVLNRTVY